ncbi:hypothetical protein FRB93_002384 [Tulasnella sp. JGI-2019a]|nr:hypothetical protein FRB93_002384 [Tulasnella sp. JGI-2019a]
MAIVASWLAKTHAKRLVPYIYTLLLTNSSISPRLSATSTSLHIGLWSPHRPTYV